MKPGLRAQRLMQAAQGHHRAGRLLQADALYREVLELQPRHAHALHMLGVISLQYDDPQAAGALLKQAADIQSDSAEIRANLGYALFRVGRQEEAVTHLRAAIASQPGHVLAYNNLGNALAQLGRQDEALECYRAAVAANPGHAESHFNLGLALRDLGKLEEAAASLATAASLKPRFAEAHNVLGAVRQEMGMLEAAAASLQAALQAKPDHADAHFNLHAVLLDLSDLQASIRCLQQAAKLQPTEPRYRFFLGMLLDYSGNASAARPQFEAAQRGSATDRARLDGWRYLGSVGVSPPTIVGSPIRAFRLGLDAARHEGLVLEFGVRFGASIRQIAALAGQEVHGFDSFEGLPEQWHREPKGAYSTKGVLPAVPANVRLHPGWFDESLPRFLADHGGPLRFVNVDCDLYSATRTVLRHLACRVVPGTVIAFDEYLGYEQWREDEFRAFQEAVREHRWRYEYLCCSFFTKQAVVRIL